MVEAAWAILDEVALGDLDEVRFAVGEAEVAAERVAGAEGASGGEGGEVWRGARDGVEDGSFGLEGRDAAHEGAGVGVARVAEERVDWGGFDETAGVHDVDVIADLADDGEVVGDEDDGGAEGALTFLDEVEDLFLDGDVEGGGGFVGDEEFRAGDEGHGDHDALAHAA